MEPITIRSRQLRKNQTPAEAVLWQHVRNRKLGSKIVRQKPVVLEYFGKKRAFIADFFCSEARLVIEIDGGVHSKKSDYDTLRTMLLQQKGYRLIRFTNDEVFGDIGSVLAGIKTEIASPLSPLSTSGEGKMRSIRGEARGKAS
ncbi:MAG: endonuclease domain-containing protein [Chitinispirillaceae bacterium]|nr:endonuclease domain-containing protein [Chitinispirillaceae bacterium]